MPLPARSAQRPAEPVQSHHDQDVAAYQHPAQQLVERRLPRPFGWRLLAQTRTAASSNRLRCSSASSVQRDPRTYPTRRDPGRAWALGEETGFGTVQSIAFPHSTVPCSLQGVTRASARTGAGVSAAPRWMTAGPWTRCETEMTST